MAAFVNAFAYGVNAPANYFKSSDVAFAEEDGQRLTVDNVSSRFEF